MMYRGSLSHGHDEQPHYAPDALDESASNEKD